MDTSSVKRDVLTTAAAAGAGGVIGAGVIQASGLTAAGMVGGGAGIGSAAGPVGTVVGVVSGIALLTVVRTGQVVSKEPKVRSAVKHARQKVGRWISGDADAAPTE